LARPELPGPRLPGRAAGGSLPDGLALPPQPEVRKRIIASAINKETMRLLFIFGYSFLLSYFMFDSGNNLLLSLSELSKNYLKTGLKFP
jgi:hypothetical protein